MANKLNKILTRIAVTGAFITTGTGFYLYNRFQKQCQTLEYVVEPMKLLQGYPYAEQILGKPITLMNLKIDRTNVHVTELQTKINIPVKGPKAKAMLFSVCERETPESKWEVKQLDLQLDPKQPKWTFYKQVGFKEIKSGDKVAETRAEVVKERLTKSDSISSKDQSVKSDTRQSTDYSAYSKGQLTKIVQTTGMEKQSEKGTEEKKKLRWL